MISEKKELKSKIVSIKEEKKELENEMKKLEDPDYIAKYVRERDIEDSHGALMGLIRGLSDWDELCADKELRQLAHDADMYYKKECYTFDD